MSVKEIRRLKDDQKRIVMLTAYDYATAQIVEEAGADIVLVGDSLANVVLGYERTAQVTMEEMLHHAKAVDRAVKKAMLVGDMPYEAYQLHVDQCVANAKRFVDEAHVGAVKLEWFDRCLDVTKRIVKAGIPVMGHVGLTPQTAQDFKVQGKDKESARKILKNAEALEAAGAFSLVLECIPDVLAQEITQAVAIPTIGIGSGVHCDGQVLVIHDLLGLVDKFKPKFVKRYADLKGISLKALKDFARDVRAAKFPDDAHTYHMEPPSAARKRR
jgi:3-methyl-2-oxobutanoate hydroxymethyltransferase